MSFHLRALRAFVQVHVPLKYIMYHVHSHICLRTWNLSDKPTYFIMSSLQIPFNKNTPFVVLSMIIVGIFLTTTMLA